MLIPKQLRAKIMRERADLHKFYWDSASTTNPEHWGRWHAADKAYAIPAETIVDGELLSGTLEVLARRGKIIDNVCGDWQPV